jgi:hypothetical protein
MRGSAVVALEVVLRADLPVRLALGLRAPEEAQPVDVDPGFLDLPRNVPQEVREGLRLRVRSDERERAPGLEPEPDEVEAVVSNRLRDRDEGR